MLRGCRARTRGSHRHFVHPERPGLVTIAGKPSAQLAEGTWRSILRIGWDRSGGAGVNYTVIYESTPTGYSAYVPDLPGCVAAGQTRAETERLIRSALGAHVAMLRSRGEPVPEPSTSSGTVTAADA